MKAFGMNLIAYDPYISDEIFKRNGCKKVETLDELLGASDVITIHTPKTSETIDMINKDNISKLKDGVRLVMLHVEDYLMRKRLQKVLEVVK